MKRGSMRKGGPFGIDGKERTLNQKNYLTDKHHACVWLSSVPEVEDHELVEFDWHVMQLGI
jgi:hypothetical protein